MKLNNLQLVCLLAASACASFAQSSAGFGAISGVVQDASGSVIPGAKVVVANDSKGIHRDLETSGAGVFSAPNLVPAAGYQVKISKSGFQEYALTGLTVAVGENLTLSPKLAVAGAATQLSVTAEAPVIDQTKVDVSQVVTTEQIQDLPINGRRVDSFVLLTPGTSADGAFGLLSFRGNPGGNSFLTDGNDTTNQFYDENAGRTRTYNISQDAVQEFQVVTSNFLAEYGRASGGVVNTVTRSGGNDIHGTFYWFFRNRTLNATDITSHGVNPPEWRHQTGASIGGPIVKDKLFYFFNGEFQRRNAPIVSSNLNNALFNASGNYIPGPASSPNCNTTVSSLLMASPAQCTAAINYLYSRVQTQLIPRKVDVNLLFGKIDWRPDQKNTISTSFNYLDFRSPNGIQTQLSLADGSAIGNNADTNVFDRTARVSWTYVVSPASVNEVRFGWFKDRQFDPASPSLLPSIGPVSLTAGGVGNVGYANGYPRLNPSEQRFQIADTISWVYGKHTMKFGFDYAHVEDYVSRLANRYGTYSFSTLTAFALDFSGNTKGSRDYTSYSQAFGNPVVDTNMADLAFFAQDEWHVTPKLTISPGLRIEHSFLPQPDKANTNPAFPQTARIPTTGANLGPRIGLAYSLNDKTAFHAGYGVFFNRYTSSTIENAFVTNGVYQATYTLNTPAQIAAGGPVFPNALTTQPNVNGTSTTLYLADSWRNPYSEQLDVSVDRQIAKDTSLSVSYVWSRGLHLLETRDANAANPTTSYTFPILDASNNQVGSYTTPLYTARVNPAYGSVYQLESNGNTYYNALLVQANRRYSKWLQGSLAYTYGHAIDYSQGGGGNTLFGSTFPTSVFNGDYRGEKGSSSIDQRHRLVISLIASPKFTNSTSVAARYLVNGWQLAVVNVNASSQPLVPTIRVQDRATGTLSTSSLNGLGGSNRVPFESISALDIGPQYRTDARLSKVLPFSERVKLYLQFEAFNLFNHVIVSGSSPRVTQQYTAIKQTSGPLNGQIALVPYAPYGSILQTQIAPDGTTARRAQVSLRLVF